MIRRDKVTKKFPKFSGRVMRKFPPMAVYKTFKWITYGERVQSIHDIVNHIWQGAGIPHRNFIDCCIFIVNERILPGIQPPRYEWTVAFGRRKDPTIIQQMRSIMEQAIKSVPKIYESTSEK